MGNLQWSLTVTGYAMLVVLVAFVVGWLLTRHRHRYGPWSGMSMDSVGRAYQDRTCRDRACNQKQLRHL